MASLEDQISIKLGLKTGDFKAALADVNAQVSSFGREGAAHADGFTSAIHETHGAMRLFHQFLVGGGIIEAVKHFYEMAISYAEKHVENTDNQTEAVRRFGEALKSTEGIAAQASVQVLGFFAQVGEGLVTKWQIWLGTIVEALDAQKALAESEKGIDELAKRRTETLKEITRLETENENLQNKAEENEFNALSHTEQRALLTARIQEQLAHAATLEAESLEFQRTKNSILKEQAQLQKLMREDRKQEDIDAAQSLDDLMVKTEQEIWDKRQADLERQKAQDDYVASVVKANQVEEESLQTIKDEADAIARAALEWGGFKAAFNSVGGSVQSLSDIQLNALIVKLQSQQSQQRNIYDPTADAYNPLLQETNLNIANAQREQSLRRQFAQTVSAFGAQYAEQSFSPTDFARLVQLLNPNTAASQAANLAAIGQTLNKLFPEYATPIIPAPSH